MHCLMPKTKYFWKKGGVMHDSKLLLKTFFYFHATFTPLIYNIDFTKALIYHDALNS